MYKKGRGDKILLSEAVELYLKTGRFRPLTEHYKRYYLNWFVRFLNDREAGEITLSDIANFEVSLTCKTTTKQTIMTAIKMLFRYLNRHFEIGINYERIEVPKYHYNSFNRITDDELIKLYNSFSSDIIGLRNRSMCALLCDTGLRLSEMLSLKRTDVAKEIEVVGAKTGIKRKVFLTDKTLKIIQHYLSLRTDEIDDLFISFTYGKFPKPLTRKIASTIFEVWGKRAGLKRCHPHMFRKFMGTKLYEKSNDIYLVKQALGHAKVNTTELYIKPDEIRFKKYMKKYNVGSEEIKFEIKDDCDVVLELNGWCIKNKARKLRKALQKAISDVLQK